MTRVLVVYCHPNPESFTAAVRDRLVSALDAGGHDVRITLPLSEIADAHAAEGAA